jgi:UDP-N-acetylglucosamine:LPS N-acetylglucosamine transferase
MVSKLGGLTTFDALACRLPFIADCITPPMPQEAGKVKLIERKGAGILLKKPGDIVPTIMNLTTNGRERYLSMRAATFGLAMPNSTEQIIREIASLIPNEERAAA